MDDFTARNGFIWNRSTLRELAGGPDADVLVVAMAEPLVHQFVADGQVVARRSLSGLVAAVEPLIVATSGVWIGHGVGGADRQMVDDGDGLAVPADEPAYRLRRVWLDEPGLPRTHLGFAADGLWPLCHRAQPRPTFRTEDFNLYCKVNECFADVVEQEARTDAPIVLVQDYELALVPKLVRTRLPRARIAAFWHVPWPAPTLFETCPWARALVEGLLAANVIGFQTPGDRDNFRGTVARVLGDAASVDTSAITYERGRTDVRAYPTSIEWPSPWRAAAPSAATCRRDVRAALRLADHAPLGMSLGRLDSSKGVEETFAAIERLLERYPEYRGVFTHVHVTTPPRVRTRTQEYARQAKSTADRVNRRFGADNYRPIVLLEEPHEPQVVYRLLRAVDVCYVGSVSDGMSLVAKTFVEAREDERGVMVLSLFAGAAWQLTDALIVNPHDLDEVATTFARALTMNADEQRQRLRCLRQRVADESAHAWAGRLLTNLLRLGLGADAEKMFEPRA